MYTAPPDDGRLVPPGWLHEAPVTVGLIGLNVCAFLVEAASAGSVADIPVKVGLAFGASYPLTTLHEGRVETLVTACFLHAGIVHLLFNMLALYQAGPLVERAVGSARMAPMYLVAGVIGYALSVAYDGFTHTGGMSVGASGAISGVIGAALVVYWRLSGWRSPLTQAMVRWLGLVIGFGFVMNATGGRIDNAAHVGGALSGALIATIWRRGARYSPAATRGILGACVAIVAGCFVVVAARDRADPFATMLLHDRVAFTTNALLDGDCAGAQSGLLAIERLETRVAGGNKIRSQIEAECGQTPAP